MNAKWVVALVLSILALIWMLVLLFAEESATAPRYRIYDLGTLGGANSAAYAINEDGAVVGSAETIGGVWSPFLWTSEDGIRDLGSLGNKGGSASGINDRGVIVGTCNNTDHSKQAFTYTVAGGMVALPSGDSSKAGAVDVNNAGVVVGSVGLECGYWDSERIWRPVATSDKDWWNAVARSVNEAGEIVGDFNDGQGILGYVWRIEGASQCVGHLGGRTSHANGINDLGTVIGYSECPGGARRPFIWMDGVMTALASFDPKYECVPWRLNNRGQIVGYGEPDPEEWITLAWTVVDRMKGGKRSSYDWARAVLWQSGKAMDLTLCLEDGQGWELEIAQDINEKGQIVGTGRKDGVARACLLEPIAGPRDDFQDSQD